MAHITIPTKETAPVKSKPILENYEKVLGAIPNYFALISQSPDALKAISDMHATLGKSLGPQTRGASTLPLQRSTVATTACLPIHSSVEN